MPGIHRQTDRSNAILLIFELSISSDAIVHRTMDFDPKFPMKSFKSNGFNCCKASATSLHSQTFSFDCLVANVTAQQSFFFKASR